MTEATHPPDLAAPPRIEQTVVSEILGSAVRDFVAACGYDAVAVTSLDDVQPGESGRELGSMISLHGHGVKGGLAFVAPVELIARLHPALDESRATERQLRDWCLEMANQILGRIKNKLVVLGVDFCVGTPVCFSGRSIRLIFVPDAPDEEATLLSFAAADSRLRVHLDCALSPGALAAPCDRLRIAAEGEVILF